MMYSRSACRSVKVSRRHSYPARSCQSTTGHWRGSKTSGLSCREGRSSSRIASRRTSCSALRRPPGRAPAPRQSRKEHRPTCPQPRLHTPALPAPLAASRVQSARRRSSARLLPLSRDGCSAQQDRYRAPIMWLAGIPVADKVVLRLAASLREAELGDTAERPDAPTTAKRGSSRSTLPTGRRSCVVLEGLPRRAAGAAGDVAAGARLAGSAKGSPSRLRAVHHWQRLEEAARGPGCRNPVQN